MKSGWLLAVIVAVCLAFAAGAFAADQNTRDTGYEAYKTKLDERY
jgi:hypothetical protein